MKDNKLIGDFMDIRSTGLSIYKESEYKYHESCFLYDSEWGWIIPVVQKIEEECGGVPEQLLDVSFYDEIGDVYQAVVEFIKEYNNVEYKN